MSARMLYLNVSDQVRIGDACIPLYRYLPESANIYLVGSVFTSPDFRDVDVRAMLSDVEYAALPNRTRRLLHLTVSVYLQQVTGLPVDFQIQDTTDANAEFSGYRSALGMNLRESDR